VQEAITFRDGAAQAFSDLEAALAGRDPTATAGIGDAVDELGAALALAARGEQVTAPARVEELAEGARALADSVFPAAWKDTGAADFDVIRTSLDRVEGALAAGEWGKAEQARLEAYALFEFGPEQRLRGLAPELFVRVEGLFWYGEGDHAGLAQLLTRKAQPEEVTATRSALDRALADAEEAVGSGPQSTFAVVTNTAIIVFREGFEAVLILAALVAGMAGVQRRLRRPLLLGAAGAVVASVLTFVVAQTVLDSLARHGEKLEAVVSLVAIAVLLVILNWFFHKVYWNDHLAGLHGRKKTILRGAGLTAAAAQLAALAMLGFSSVYREGFETVLFLQAMVLEAGAGRVAQGVALGLAGVGLIAVATIALQRKLPHKRMLELTGVLILAVLVVMVGKTVQVCQVVGWLPVNVIGGVRLPYWAGAWFGVFPTWEGLAAQVVAVVLVRRKLRRGRALADAASSSNPRIRRPTGRARLEREPERVESPA
jgi:high-affinity iron transporter